MLLITSGLFAKNILLKVIEENDTILVGVNVLWKETTEGQSTDIDRKLIYQHHRIIVEPCIKKHNPLLVRNCDTLRQAICNLLFC